MRKNYFFSFLLSYLCVLCDLCGRNPDFFTTEITENTEIGEKRKIKNSLLLCGKKKASRAFALEAPINKEER